MSIEPEGDWVGLYKGQTSRDDYLFTKESVRHPAKMALALTNKILDQMIAWGWIENGRSLVADPFGGRGTTALCWLARHPENRAITAEVEPHFVEIQRRCKIHAEKKLGRPLHWTILLGDSRRFDELLRGASGDAGASVTSAPWEGADNAHPSFGRRDPVEVVRASRAGEGQDIENWKRIPPAAQPDGALTSAPYEDSIHPSREGPGAAGNAAQRAKIAAGDPGQHAARSINAGYGDPAAVTSAPYGENVIGRGQAERLKALTQDPTSSLHGRNPDGEWFRAMEEGYHGSEGNINELPDGDWAALTSAPYENSVSDVPRDVEHKRELLEAAGHDADAWLGKARCPQVRGYDYRNDPTAAVTSAPYENSLDGGEGPNARHDFKTHSPGNARTNTAAPDYRAEEPQAALTSAPWEDSLHDDGHAGPEGAAARRERAREMGLTNAEHVSPLDYREKRGYGDAAITSAPYENSAVAPQGADGGAWNNGFGKARETGDWSAVRASMQKMAREAGYGEAALTSAPYEDSITDQPPGIDMAKSKRLASGRKHEGASSQVVMGGYQSSAAPEAGQPTLADAVVTSAPWEQTLATQDPDFLTPGEREKRNPSKSNMPSYSADAAVTSAPYGPSEVMHAAGGIGEAHRKGGHARDTFEGDTALRQYGKTEGQIGNLPDPPEAAVTSAPYAERHAYEDNERCEQAVEKLKAKGAGIGGTHIHEHMGDAPGQIARLPEPFDAAVTSAPYSGDVKHDRTFDERDARAEAEKGLANQCGRGSFRGSQTYGDTEGQIGALPDPPDSALLSAPYEQSLASDDPDKRGGLFKDPKRRNDPTLTATYQPDAGVTSAPYEQSVCDRTGIERTGEGAAFGPNSQAIAGGYGAPDAAATSAPYEDSAQPGGGEKGARGGDPMRRVKKDYVEPGATAQIGVTQGETYADACGQVYASLARAGIRYVASVTKDPVKDKKLRPLRELTIRLFEKAGYRLVAWRRAWLYHTQAEVEALSGQGTLFDEEEVEPSKKLHGRLSFFRRLSLNKGGIAAQWEDVLFFELAEAGP